MRVSILYRNMEFIFPCDDDSCWFHLDGASSIHGKYEMKINADRDVYAVLLHEGKCVEGYITEEDQSPIPDNFPISDDVSYHFKKLKKPGYYL